MILLFSGGLLFAAGLLSGAILIAAPFGWLSMMPNAVTWALFPLFCVLGFVSMSVGARDLQAARRMTFVLSGLVLALSKVAALGLFLTAIGVAVAPGTLAGLWYVFALAGLFGVLGIAAGSRALTAD